MINTEIMESCGGPTDLWSSTSRGVTVWLTSIQSSLTLINM